MEFSQVGGRGKPAQRGLGRVLALLLMLGVVSLLLSACVPEGQQAPSPTGSHTPTPARKPTHTRTPEFQLPARTALPTLTSSPAASITIPVTTSPTSSPTSSPTPPPGISLLWKEIIEFYRGVDFRFTRSGYVQGELVITGYSPNGFTTLTLRGGPDNLNSAEIQIFTAGEPARLSTDYWQAFLGFTTPDPVMATDWVKKNIPTAGIHGRVETQVGYVKLILVVEKNILKLTVLPNH